MDYFTELLESYSKLKKRNLKLLEAEKKPTKKKPAKKSGDSTTPEKEPTKVMTQDEARTAAWNAPVGPPFGTIAQVKNKEGVMRDVLAYKAAAQTDPTTGLDNTTDTPEDNGGHVVAANVTKTGNKATILDAKGNPTEQFEAWYMRNFPGEAEEGVVDSVSTEAEDRAGRQFESAGLFDEELNANMVTMLERVTNMATVAQTLGIEQGWMNPSRMGNYVTGSAATSMERKLANGTIATISEEGGFEISELAVSSNLGLMRGATESMNLFLSFATEGESAVTNDNKDKMCRDLPLAVRRVTGQKKAHYVFHADGDQSEGIVMPKSDIFDFAAERMEEICEDGLEQIRKGTEEAQFTEAQLADYRGTGLEVTFAAATFYSTIGDIESQGGDVSKVRRKFGQYLRRKILEDLDKFEEAHKWARDLVDSGVATTLDSHFIADALLDLGKIINKPDGLHEYLSTAMALEEAIISTGQMYPDMSIPVGTTTGNGYKDDLKYVYLDHAGADSPAAERAEEAVRQFNLEGGDAAIQSYTIGELRELNPELVEIYQEAYTLKDSDTVSVVGCSVKSYKSGESTKGGEFKTWKKRNALVMGQKAGAVAPGFELKTQERLGFVANPQLLKAARDYQEDLDAMYTSMDSILPAGSTGMTGPNGNISQINFETAIPIIKKAIGGLPVDDKIRARIEKLFKGGAINLKDKQTRLKFKEQVTRLLVTAKQNSDCNQRDTSSGKLTAHARSARLNLAYTTQLCGGVLHDTVINKKLLEANKTLAGSHQKPINDATRGIIAFDKDDKLVDARKKDSLAKGEGAWDVKLEGSATTLRLKKRGTQKYLSLGAKRKKMDDGSVDTNTSAHISSDLQDEYLTLRKKLKKGKEVEDSLMMTYLKGHAKLLEQLLVNR